ncbi:MAG: hypothetical protein NT047_07445 [Deltaproteobacteria bacterium]|nr:hypothetical protein [Deltaproteobacteria bacterium]
MNENKSPIEQPIASMSKEGTQGESAKAVKSAGEEESITNVWRKAVSFLSNTGGRSFVVAVGIFYVLGFLVINAHLNKYGVSDLDIANVRYLAAGAVYTFYLVLFYLFGGRAILFTKKWMGEEIDFLRKTGASERWSLLAFIHSFVHLIFFLCLSAASFSSIAFSGTETFFFYGVLSLAFLIDYTMDVRNLDVRYPKLHLVIQFAIKIPAIVVFFILAESWKPITVFFTYLGIAMYLNFVLDNFERHRMTADKILFSAIYTIVFFLGTAVSFGALTYGDVSRKIGGGHSIEANIALKEEYSELLNSKGQSLSNLEVKVIYVTNKHLYVEINNETIRIPDSSIKWLALKKQSSSAFSKRFFPELKDERSNVVETQTSGTQLKNTSSKAK